MYVLFVLLEVHKTEIVRIIEDIFKFVKPRKIYLKRDKFLQD